MTTWFKLDDGFDEDLKVCGLTDAAYRLAIAGMCYASRRLTDGLVPAAVAARLVPHADPDELVGAGLWEPSTERPGMYQIHDYLDHNRSKAQVEVDRAGAAARKAKSRAKKLASQSGHTVTDGAPHSVSHTVTDGAPSSASHTVTRGDVTPQETETETETNTPQPAPPELDAETLHGIALAGVSGLLVGPTPLGHAIRARALELEISPAAVARGLNENLAAAPLPNVSKPWGFLSFRLAQVTGPNPPAPATVPANQSTVLAGYEQPTDDELAAIESKAHQPDEELPNMTPKQARAVARAAALETNQAAAS